MKVFRTILFISLVVLLGFGWQNINSFGKTGEFFVLFGTVGLASWIVWKLNGPGGTTPPDYPP